MLKQYSRGRDKKKPLQQLGLLLLDNEKCEHWFYFFQEKMQNKRIMQYTFIICKLLYIFYVLLIHIFNICDILFFFDRMWIKLTSKVRKALSEEVSWTATMAKCSGEDKLKIFNGIVDEVLMPF